MKFPRLHSAETIFVDTPEGIFTASGVWFRTREASLYAYAGPVFDHEPLPRLLTQAEVWLRSPQTLALWLLPLLLFTMSPLQAEVGRGGSTGVSFALAFFARGNKKIPAFLRRAR